jgi:hypothetical protein
MDIEFVETMRGWLKTASGGAEHPISFEVHAQGSNGRFQLRGLISAPPLALESVASGTLTMRPLPLIRSIAYHLQFPGQDGQRYTLEAEKRPTPLAPIRSMTEMPATVRDPSGAIVAEGMMFFDLRDLPSFAASWLPIRRTAQRLLDTRRRALERRLLSQS